MGTSRKSEKWKHGKARKQVNVKVKDFCKYEKLKYKKNKLKLDIDFLNKCKQLGVYSKFLILKQVFTMDFYILKKPIILYHNKSLQKSLYPQQKKIVFTDEGLQLTCIHS